MYARSLRWTLSLLLFGLIGAACAPQAAPPPADNLATHVARGVADVLTQTAAAPTPTASSTPTPSATPTITPTSAPPKPPVVIAFAPCWRGPGPAYVLVSNIAAGVRVDLHARSSLPGWYVILNPYFRNQACWIQAQYLSIHAGTDLSRYPIITPVPLTPTAAP